MSESTMKSYEEYLNLKPSWVVVENKIQLGNSFSEYKEALNFLVSKLEFNITRFTKLKEQLEKTFQQLTSKLKIDYELDWSEKLLYDGSPLIYGEILTFKKGDYIWYENGDEIILCKFIEIENTTSFTTQIEKIDGSTFRFVSDIHLFKYEKDAILHKLRDIYFRNTRFDEILNKNINLISKLKENEITTTIIN